ncbi:HEAT repeat domain-containing protein [Anabaena catenula]|uniref:HEAT repeat domain-containing protein n=1 Tax=Anabaena catenula FACHB-362 TaxID=2692877 RepID=A0ABR8J620_9NOST|nr:HEAT repeat domain-containing protein [Anabaena catenula]MBD2693299.1 HEAT repeat domain-containing protein [Anabaena catenula FACHB-362]
MNPSAATTPEDQFLKAMATQYGFTGDTYAVFLSRFHSDNYSKTNQILISDIPWNKDPVNKTQKIQDELETICEVLKQDGFTNEKPKPGRPPKGKSPWEQAYKWLWETKFQEWKITQNLVIPNEQVEKAAVCNFFNQIISEFQYIKLFHTTQPIILKDQYIPIQVTLERKYTHTIENTWNYAESEAEIQRAYSLKHSEESKPTQVDWQEAQKQHQYLMVLADPGMGKTTLLKREAYLTTQVALQSLEDNSQTLENLVIPIFLRLSEIADATKDITAKVSDAILKLLASKYENHFPQIETFLVDKLKTGKCLLLLDALDEVAKESRNYLSEKLNSFIRNYNCPIICTSRIVGYSGVFLDGAKDVEIVPFNEPQINQYIETWFNFAAESINDNSVSAAALIRELQNKPQIRGLVQNPLLLSLICSLYQEKGINLPARRYEVYEQAVKCMLTKWRKTHNPEVEDGWIDVKIELLEELAYQFSCNNQEIFTMRELRKAIDSYLKKDDIPSDFKNITSSTLITELSEQDGILQKLHESGQQYLFLHRTFQEYFTACYLQRSPDGIELAKAHFWDYEWHETLSLMAGLMQNSVTLLQAIKNEKDDIFNTLLLLAGRCTAEVKESNHELVKKIIDDIYAFWLSYPNAEFITAVVVAVGKTQSQMFEKLKTMLNDKDKTTLKQRVISILREIGNSQIIPCLIQILTSYEDMFVRLMAAGALGDIGNTEVIPELIEASNNDKCELVRKIAESALNKLTFSSFNSNYIGKTTSNHSDDLEDLINIKMIDIQTLINLLLCSEDEKIRRSAAYHLGRIGHPVAVNSLILALKDGDENVRGSVVTALEKIGNEEAINVLIQSLNHPDYNVREDVINALGNIANTGNLEAVNAVIKSLEHPDSNVQKMAAFILGEISIYQSVNSLIKVLQNINHDSSVRETAAEALGKIGAIKAIPVLITTLTEQDSSVKRMAAEALVKIGTSDTLAKLIQNPNIDIYDSDIFFLARQLAVRFSKEKVPFIPVYSELLGQSFDV